MPKTKSVSGQITYWLGVIAVGLTAGLGIQFATAWTEPSSAPPGGNLGAPINTGGDAQYKAGALGVGGLLRGYSDAYFNGNVGIGTTSPGAKLDVNGHGRFRDGLTVGQATDAYSYITMKDDESPGGHRYIHANTGLIGFLTGPGGWAVNWDTAANMRNYGNINANGDVCTSAGNCLNSILNNMYSRIQFIECTIHEHQHICAVACAYPKHVISYGIKSTVNSDCNPMVSVWGGVDGITVNNNNNCSNSSATAVATCL